MIINAQYIIIAYFLMYYNTEVQIIATFYYK